MGGASEGWGAGALVVAWATMAGEGGGIGGVGGPLGMADGRSSYTEGSGGGGGGEVSGGGSLSRLYPCPDCDKVFRHPRSYYQHQHVHRGTHSCPGCRKLFSRRWDLLRHLNKNKYGCPARWRESGRHPPYHNSLSLSALATAAAAATTTTTTTQEAPSEDHTMVSAPWTMAATAAPPHRSRSSGSGQETRPPEPPAATTMP
ncbi:hypothetical protein Pcinc_027526 [Petrolisthes cinctipes]|uniref:C2H2-type domain-containing protein n=1 Tax=Petrolisthes cinctipes TaxID=88211 RepID=A0AAE1F3T2_PETCI|nr:hypothetical protein Pcinc_027526 [Petrolisthes cinctipes]